MPSQLYIVSLNIFLSHAEKKTPTLFEDSLAELEQLVSQLEQGDISLEESLQSFERGVNLTRTCQKALQEAEQKVQILIEKNGTQTLEPFTDE
jgi:exodeoxyribonuclease VII, small subunit